MYTWASNLHPEHLDSLVVLLFLGSFRLRLHGSLKRKPGMIMAPLFKMIWQAQLWSTVKGVLNLWTGHCMLSTVLALSLVLIPQSVPRTQDYSGIGWLNPVTVKMALAGGPLRRCWSRLMLSFVDRGNTFIYGECKGQFCCLFKISFDFNCSQKWKCCDTAFPSNGRTDAKCW